MDSTSLSPRIKRYILDIFAQQPLLEKIVAEIARNKGSALLVGGAVRDLIMGKESKDIDIEVHGLTLEQLESLLKKFGPVSAMGKAFGVLRLHALDVDWSLPRQDTSGRKPEVKIDPHLDMKTAFARRDLTINAMGINFNTYELIDPFNGLRDIQEKRLRAPDPTFFVEDPLRFYRVMQFISRFEFYPDAQLNELCRTMDVSTVSRERIEAEFEKMLLKSARPSLGLRWIHDIGRLQELFPELFALVGVGQDPEHHPEGDAFEHTMQALDAAHVQARPFSHYLDKLILMYAALCHDLGKPYASEMVDGRIRSHGHEEKGIEPARNFLARITQNQTLIDAVLVLVRYHMQPGQFIANGAKAPAYKRLARNCAPATNLFMLAQLAFADRKGRNAAGSEPLTGDDPMIEEFLKKAEQAQVAQKPEEPALQGRDLMDTLAPGPEMGKVLKKAYEIQIEQGIRDKEELKRMVLGK